MALPDAVIVEEILIRLPVKLVVRFRSVCKLWNSLLSQPSYVQSLLNCSISQNPNDDYLVCVTEKPQRPGCISILSRTKLSEIPLDNVPYPGCIDDYTELVGSINGLVCTVTHCWNWLKPAGYKSYYFILWNPVMNRYTKILPPKDCLSKYKIPGHSLFGFAWDFVADKYKIIIHATDSDQAAVYSCETDSWSNIVVSISDRNSGDQLCWSQSVNVKGICYWDCFSTYGQILKFEPRNNEFTYLTTPGKCNCVKLVNLNDGLALVEYTKLNRRDDIIDNIDVYYMSEESSVWIKIYTNINSRINNFKSVISCFKSGGMVVLNEELKFYDPKSNEIKNSSLSCSRHSGRCDKVCYSFFIRGCLSYTPSLVAPPRNDPVKS